jgi:hypothetical protein
MHYGHKKKILSTLSLPAQANGILLLMLITGCAEHPGALRMPDASELQGRLQYEEVAKTCVFDFENPGDIDAWTLSEPKSVTREKSSDWPSDGHSMKVSFDPGFNWPSVRLKRPGKDEATANPKLLRFYEILDGGAFDVITMKMRNPEKREIGMLVNGVPFRLPADSVVPMEFSIFQLADKEGGKNDKINHFNMTGFPEQGKFTIYIDEIGFGRRPDNRAYHLAAAREAARKRAAMTGADSFVLAIENPMRQVFPEPCRYTPKFASSYSLRAARNESESLQVVVCPTGGALKNLRWSAGTLRNKDRGELPLSVRVVGYVKCDPVRYVLNADGGWYPDLLIDADHVAVAPADTYVSLWVKVQVPSNAAPGLYHGKIEVMADGSEKQSVEIEMEVWPFTLPTRPRLKQAYALNAGYNGHGLAKLYPPERIEDMRKKFEDMLVGEYRMDANNIYYHTPPWHWDAERLRELKGMGLTGVCLGQFTPHPEWFPGMNPNFDERIAEIKEYMKVVDEAGVRDICYFYGYDEVGPDKVKDLFEVAAKLKEHFPDIPFLTTATAYQQNVCATMEGSGPVDWWSPIFNAFFWQEPSKRHYIRLSRERGHKLWYYICNCSPAPEPNFDIELSPVEPRILTGSLAVKYEVIGFLYYALSYWGNNALPADVARLPFVEWNPNGISWPDRYNGQGILIAAGENGPIPTIRMEMIRDGLEDFDYYSILREAGGDAANFADVPEIVALNGFHHSTDPAVIEAERGRLAAAILKFGLKGSEGEKTPEQRIPRVSTSAKFAETHIQADGFDLPLQLDKDKAYTLRLQLPGYMRLINLGEIQVFNGDENIASRGRARMSSQNEKHPAENLISGRVSGKAADEGGLAHTHYEMRPWAEIELPSTDKVDRIVVWNRFPEGEDCTTRLIPFKLTICDADKNVVWETLIRHARIQTLAEAKAGDNRFQKIEIGNP